MSSKQTTSRERIPFVDWANLHTHLIWIYDGKVEPRWRNGIVASPYLTAWLVRQGSIEISLGSTKLEAQAGEWLFPPCGHLWRKCSVDTRILSIRFHAAWPTGEKLFEDGLGVVLPAASHPELERAAKPLARFIAQHFPSNYRYLMDEPATLQQHLRLQALFARWLDSAVAALTYHHIVPTRMGRIDPRLLKAVRIMERKVFSAPLAERELAKEVGLSLSQFARLFVRQFGVSPHDHFDRRREEHALAALESSSLSIKEIAFQLGFSSLPHFSAWFRRRRGISPRQFRGGISSGEITQTVSDNRDAARSHYAHFI
jgi:AraC-like DNA-binding protein